MEQQRLSNQALSSWVTDLIHMKLCDIMFGNANKKVEFEYYDPVMLWHERPLSYIIDEVMICVINYNAFKIQAGMEKLSTS